MRPILYNYPDIRHRSPHSGRPEYPERCPLCNSGASPWSEPADRYHGPTYKCGGRYRFKPQIQNHTDVWAGYCPVRREQDRVANGIPCANCGELNLVGVPFEWDCIFCDHKNSPKELL